MEEEIWKEIINYNGRYDVSNTGRVRSNKRKIKGIFNSEITIGGIILKKVNSTPGYYVVTLCLDGKTKISSIHRLVAQAFIPNPDNKPQVNHKNGIRTDNRVENLEWCTQSENNKHSYDVLGRVTPNKGITKPIHNSTPVYQIDLITGEIVDGFDSAIQASQKFGDFSYNGARKIARVCRKQRGPKLFGYTWAFKKDYIPLEQKEIDLL